MILDCFSEEERRVLVFAHAYERTRRDRGQFGYRMWQRIVPDVVDLPVFKQCRTVVRWLNKEGWRVTWNEIHWQGYIRFCFRHMAPTVPHPGQLRNVKLLRLYLTSPPCVVKMRERSVGEMEAIYRRVIDPELTATTTLSALGLLPRSESESRAS